LVCVSSLNSAVGSPTVFFCKKYECASRPSAPEM
jgi:hypothetical protein